MTANNSQTTLVFDDAFLAALRRGDDAAWERFFIHYDHLIRSVVSWSKWHFPPTLQEDLLQNIRFELNKSIDRFKGDSSLDYFVKRVCIHRCIDEVRRQVRQRQVFSPMTQQNDAGEEYDITPGTGRGFDPVAAVAVAERAEALKRILLNLNENCRDAVRYFYFEGLSYKEIASKMDVSVITVGTRLGKCLNKLRTLLKKDSFFGEDFSSLNDS